MIALARLNKPALLIADEPTTALDPTVQLQILALLKRSVGIERNDADHSRPERRGRPCANDCSSCIAANASSRGRRRRSWNGRSMRTRGNCLRRSVPRGPRLRDPRARCRNHDTASAYWKCTNVSVTFATRERIVHAVRDCSLELRARRGARVGRRIRFRQDRRWPA